MLSNSTISITKAPIEALDSLKHSMAQLQVKVDSLQKISQMAQISGPTATDIIQAICAILVTLIAAAALFTWRWQKKFETQIELLNNTSIAKDFVSLLREEYPDFSQNNLLTNELKRIPNTYLKRKHLRVKTMDFKKPKLEEFLKIIQDMKSKAWAMFGINDPFYKFYDHILDIKMSNITSHIAMGFTEDLLSKNDLSEYERKDLEEVEENIRKKLYVYPLDEDQTMLDIEKDIKELEKSRSNIWPF